MTFKRHSKTLLLGRTQIINSQFLKKKKKASSHVKILNNIKTREERDTACLCGTSSGHEATRVIQKWNAAEVELPV